MYILIEHEHGCYIKLLAQNADINVLAQRMIHIVEKKVKEYGLEFCPEFGVYTGYSIEDYRSAPKKGSIFMAASYYDDETDFDWSIIMVNDSMATPNIADFNPIRIEDREEHIEYRFSAPTKYLSDPKDKNGAEGAVVSIYVPKGFDQDGNPYKPSIRIAPVKKSDTGVTYLCFDSFDLSADFVIQLINKAKEKMH